MCHWFTVDDLHFLKRGGRISATTEIIGTMLSIKPVMHVDDEGRLIKVEIAKGRKMCIRDRPFAGSFSPWRKPRWRRTWPAPGWRMPVFPVA